MRQTHINNIKNNNSTHSEQTKDMKHKAIKTQDEQQLLQTGLCHANSL